VDLEDPESPKLIKKQVPEPSTGYKTTYEVIITANKNFNNTIF